MKSFNDTTVIIPTFNEAENVSIMINELFKLYPKIHIIIADGDSKDRTISIVKKLQKKYKTLRLIINKTKVKGLTHDVLLAVKKTSTPYLVVIDCDFQHPPKKISNIVTKLRKGCDIVIGTREFLPKDWPFTRKLMSESARVLGKARLMLSGVSVVDVMSGFFGVKTSFFKAHLKKSRSSFVMEGYKVLFDLLKLCNKDVKICKVTYVFDLRKRGESKIGSRQVIAYLKSIIR